MHTYTFTHTHTNNSNSERSHYSEAISPIEKEMPGQACSDGITYSTLIWSQIPLTTLSACFLLVSVYCLLASFCFQMCPQGNTSRSGREMERGRGKGGTPQKKTKFIIS